MEETTAFLGVLAETLPPVFTRKEAAKHLGGLFTPAGLANLDSEGQGPGGLLVGKAIAYRRDRFLNWLEDYMRTCRKTARGGNHD
ncbi:MAG: hypothetical protein LBS31_00710 [Candidatus Adiutrix sp.]|nr:hypothetical protein [Candidatus Adiutrix sp.]